MSDLKIAEFRERAERGVPTPDVAEIERRGRALRRRRVAGTAGALALVLAAGLGIANGTMDDDAAPQPVAPPSQAPSTSWDEGVRTTFDSGEEVLLPGPSSFRYPGTTVSFDVPGPRWEWWGGGMGLRRSAEEIDEYGAAVMLLPDPSARLQPCRAGRVGALGTDPDNLIGNVTPLLDLARARVLQGPRLVTAFGGDAVHLRLQTSGSCPDAGNGPLQLRGQVDGEDFDPGFPGERVLDVWHVVLPGAGPAPASLLITSWDLDGTEQHRAQQRALVDSLRFGAPED